MKTIHLAMLRQILMVLMWSQEIRQHRLTICLLNIPNYIYNKITGGPITGYRDFSQAALRTMTDAARETEEEAWWRIDRWDCWYRADKLLGGFVMDFQRLSGQVDTYYRKVIDMNDASVKDIEKIFQKVYSLDDTYSARIRSGNSQLQTQILKKLQDLADSISPKVCSPYTNEE